MREREREREKKKRERERENEDTKHPNSPREVDSISFRD